MNLFNTEKPEDKLSRSQILENKSEAAIAVFNNTLNTLVDLEEDVDSQIEEKQSDIRFMEVEIENLERRKAKNGKFITKLKEFFD